QDSVESAIRSQGQCIWRYHPGTGVYEVFGEGGGNSFGLEIDSRGRIFSGHNGGNTRGFHYVQGGYYRKGFEKHGSLSNPYAFGFFEQMPHDNVPRFTHQFVIYEGTSADAPQANGLPAQYHGQLFGIGPLQGHVVRSELSPHESSLKTRDIDHPVTTTDTWFRPVDLQQGPDGALYIVDLYEQRIDHASHYQGRIDRDRGRVYRLKRRGGSPLPPFDLATQSPAQLVELLQHPNRWFRETVLNLLAWKQPLEVLPTLRQRVAANTQDTAVAPLWALNRLHALNEPAILEFLSHASPWVRNWTIRLACDSGPVSPAVLARLVSLAQVESSAIVRSQLASSARRLPGPQALALIEPLLSREADLADVHIPLLAWWALEAHAESSRDAVVSLFRKPTTWERRLVREQIAERLMRRYALAGTRRVLLTCAQLLDAAPTDELKGKLLAGFEKAYEGRALVGLPEELLQAVARAGGGSTALRLRQQDPAALQEALALLGKPDAPRADRLRFLQILAETHPPAARPVLLELARQAQDAELAGQAISALQAYDDPALAGTLVGLLSSLPAEARQTAL
ncbi:MAG: dehydrogenase, partial [Planctomycetaceae bacterium]